MKQAIGSSVLVAIVLSAFPVSPPADAQTVALTRDIATEPIGYEKLTLFPWFAEANGIVYYNDDDGVHGEELWRTDGTAAGTWQVADLSHGFLPSVPSELTAVGEIVYFRAYGNGSTPNPATVLWRSDGTATGTYPIADVDVGPWSATELVEFEGALLFVATDDVHGSELWRAEPDDSISLVIDLEPGPTGSIPASLLRVGDRVYFTASTSEYGRELWHTDGTSAGTTRVTDLLPGAEDGLRREDPPGPPWYFGSLSGALLFAGDDELGRHLWRTEGTPETTEKLASVESPHLFTPLRGELLFAAATDDAGEELWATDGTVSGTRRVADIEPGTASSQPDKFNVVGEIALFTAAGSVHGRELWRTDGTEEGTFLVRDIRPGLDSSIRGGWDPHTTAGDLLFFDADDGVHGRELWVSDGTAEGTDIVRDIAPGEGDGVASYPPPFPVSATGHVLFFATEPATGRELWRSDGTPGGTALVRDVYTQHSSSYGALLGLSELRVVGDRAFFRARHPETGIELWTSDGTELGTHLVSDIYEGLREPDLAHSSYPRGMTPVGEWLYFAAEDPDGEELWRTHVETLVTERVLDLDPTSSSSPESLQRFGDELLFTADVASRELWLSAGTGESTRPITTAGGKASAVRSAEGVAYFAYEIDPWGDELWRTDGTPEGTSLVTDLSVGEASSRPRNLVTIGDRVVFTAETPETGREWWTSDGTEGGTTLLRDIEPGSGSSIDLLVGSAPYSCAEEPLRVGDRIYLFAGSAETGRELWRTDGTTEGTSLVRDVREGPISSQPYELVASGEWVYFSADDGIHGRELWRTDGTEAGTLLVEDVEPGPGDGSPGFLSDYRGRLLFSAHSAEAGVELWTTDGTARGTRRLTDLHPGPDSGSPHLMTAAGDRVFLFGTNGTLGFEPLVIEP